MSFSSWKKRNVQETQYDRQKDIRKGSRGRRMVLRIPQP